MIKKMMTMMIMTKSMSKLLVMRKRNVVIENYGSDQVYDKKISGIGCLKCC